MSSAMQFGKNRRDQFSYLIVTGLFILAFAIIMPFLAKGFLGVTEDFYNQYKIFYQICGAAIGFAVAQVYIRVHSKSFRRGVVK